MPDPMAKSANNGRQPRREPQINTSAGHVFDALRVVAASPGPIGGTDVAHGVGVPVSTAHRALVTLEEMGFVTRREGGPKFRLGLQALELVAALTSRYAIRLAAQDCLKKLSELSGETTTLAIQLGWYEVRIDGYQGRQAVHRPLRIGERSVLHRTVTGRALLAGQPAEAVHRYVRSAQAGPLPSIEVRRLREELVQIAERGYAVEDGATPGSDSGVTTVAFPVRHPDDTVVGVIAVCGPSGQFRPDVQPLDAWQELVRGVEAEVAARPALFTDPFAHLSPDSVVMSDPAHPAR